MTQHRAGKWIALFVSFLTTVIMFISYVGYSPLVPEIMADLEIGYTEVGWLASISTITAGVVVLFTGALIDRLGPKKVIVLSLWFLVLCQILNAIATDYVTLLLVRALMGASIGLLLVAPYTMAMRWFERDGRLGLAMGVMLTTDGIGAAFGVYVWAISTSALGWRGQAWMGAVVIGVTAIIAGVLLREPPQFVLEKRESIASAFAGYRRVLRDRRVWGAVLFLTGIWGPYSIGAFWLPTILMEDAGWSEPTSGLVSSLYALAGVITGVVFGLLSDLAGKRRQFILISGIATTLAFAAAAVFLQSSDFLMLAVMLPIAGLAAYIGLPLTYALAADSVGINRAATANGVILGLGFLAGATVFPLVLGASKGLSGNYTLGFYVIVAAQLLCNVIAPMFLSKDVARQAEAQKSESARSLPTSQ